MSYLHQQLMEQRVADLRRVDGSQQAEIRIARSSRPRPVRAATGRALVRLGERLAAPAGRPVTR